jgi:hypothetical protein
MSTLTPTSELDAVNIMLGVIGEAPVSSLAISGLVDVAVAKQVLSEVSRQVQAKGWHFNTETNYPLPLSPDGTLTIPPNTLKLDTTRAFSSNDVTIRGTRLYNKTTHSFVFDKSVEVEFVQLLPFEDMPESARYYVTLRAARKFQDRMLGSEALHAYSDKDETDALDDLNEAEGEAGDYNMFTDSMSVSTIWRR